MNTFSRTHARPALLLTAALLACPVHGAESRRDPMAILSALADRIYTVGETSGSAADMIAAETAAAAEVRQYVASGATDGLLGPAKGKSPLATAAYMGYPDVVAALLAAPLVRAHIDDADEMGVTPWIAANFSMKQSLWACNPAVFGDPFKFVPMLVTQPYYLTNPVPPYQKTRELLEQAGAHADMARAKDVWLANCKNRSPAIDAEIRGATDLQKTVQALGATTLTEQLQQMQKKAAEARKQ